MGCTDDCPGFWDIETDAVCGHPRCVCSAEEESVASKQCPCNSLGDEVFMSPMGCTDDCPGFCDIETDAVCGHPRCVCSAEEESVATANVEGTSSANIWKFGIGAAFGFVFNCVGVNMYNSNKKGERMPLIEE